MSEKSLQKRLIDEAAHFDVLYKQFEERHRAWVDAGNPADPWLSMFDIAFEKSLCNRCRSDSEKYLAIDLSAALPSDRP